MKGYQIRITLLLVLFAAITPTTAQIAVSQPEKATLITTDISNFWAMFDQLPQVNSTEDTLQILHDFYLSQASPALQEYFDVERRENNKIIETEYLAILRQYPKYLASIRSNTESIVSSKEKIYECFHRAKELYPEFTFRDTYFCIGFFNSGGKSMAQGGLYIGTEMFALSDDTVLDEWQGSAWLQFFNPIDHIHNIVLHEQTHFQQSPPANNDYNLLYNAINEGASVFLVDLVTDSEGITNGGGIGKTAFRYGEANEEEVWKLFKKDMNSNDQSKWFYNAETTDWPKDMGYYVGYKICRSYYDNAQDKATAIKNIFEATGATKLLADSGYEAKF